MQARLPANEFVHTIERFQELWNCKTFRFTWHSLQHFSVQPVVRIKGNLKGWATAPAKHFYSDHTSFLVAGRALRAAAKLKKKTRRKGFCVVNISELGLVTKSFTEDAVVEISLPKNKGNFACRIVYTPFAGAVETFYPQPARGRL